MKKPIIAIMISLFASQAFAQKADCTLANLLDSHSYQSLTTTAYSEAGEDSSASSWADCRATKLSTELTKTKNLKLLSRIDALRKQFREMRGIESELVGMRAGGGTMYAHAVPRSFPLLEEQLAGLAGLALTKQGGSVGEQYSRIITFAKQDHEQYVGALKNFKPDASTTAVAPFDMAAYNKQVARYDQLAKSVMLMLGQSSDATTAHGYLILTSRVFGDN